MAGSPPSAVIGDALPAQQLAAFRQATDRVMRANLAVDPDASAGGGAGGLPHRYSFGSTSASRHRLHEQEWVDVIDLTWENGPIRQIPGDAHQQWLTLSEHGRRISRYVAAAPGEVVLGAGFDHPRAAHRSAFLEQQASELGTDIAAQWWAKR